MSKSFGRDISAIYRHIQVRLNKKFTQFGFGSGQYLYFSRISQYEGVSQKELSIMLATDKATTAKAVQKLISLGYIYKVQLENDKRCYKLYLSDKGHEILPDFLKILRATTGILKTGMSEEEIESAHKLLDIMFINITNHNKQEKDANEKK